VIPGGAESAGDLRVVPAPRRTRPWYSKILALCLVVFCFEIGVFLLVFPWLELWETNRAATYAAWLADIWGNPFFRGALSGLGALNIYIALLEAVRLIRGFGAQSVQ
jgi:hypothetical protein